MSSRSERERRIVIKSGSPLAKHSMNQEKIKSSLEGERRLGIRGERGQSGLSQEFEDLRSDDLFIHFCEAARRFDEEGLPIPERAGLFALGMSSLINARLKEDPQAFLEGFAGAKKYTYSLGSPLEKLISKTQMVSNFFKRSKMPHKPEYLYIPLRGAAVFAYNFGALNFGQGEEVAALHALIGINNISIYLASEINEQNLPVMQARQMVMAFGETTKRHLQTLKPKKHFQAKKRR